MLDISEAEAGAVRLRGANTVHIPGMLQTPAQAMAIFRAVVPQLPEHEVALRLNQGGQGRPPAVGPAARFRLSVACTAFG
ncbi:Scr1 family TA system antitoxin-like transcriptional regulator [Streptomyces sp. NPDC020965]|uniref:Scr1 family TA system antitoxin-like transcriptional regulator n=1 Tax=Streptomyces sp. NPDC020965 TaxID=3365105 RepID=UPI0037ABD38B